MRPYRLALRALILSAFAFSVPSAAFAQTAEPTPPVPTPGNATHVMGFEDAKRDSKAKISVDDKSLKFGKTAIDLSSIQDIFAGSEGRQTGGKTLTVVKMAVPYGGGRVLSLFSREQVDNITIDYTDANGGAHSAIFMLPKGQAEALKKQMVDHGAKASIPVKDEPAKTDAPKEKK